MGLTGELTDNLGSFYTVDPDTDSHFSILTPGNVAELFLDDTYWQNTLYQDFTLDTLLLGWTMDITFWIKWSFFNRPRYHWL